MKQTTNQRRFETLAYIQKHGPVTANALMEGLGKPLSAVYYDLRVLSRQRKIEAVKAVRASGMGVESSWSMRASRP